MSDPSFDPLAGRPQKNAQDDNPARFCCSSLLGLQQIHAIAVLVLIMLAGTAVSIAWQHYVGGGLQVIDTLESSQHPPPLLIDINRADWIELTLLPEISEIMAKRIVGYRNAHGPFVNIEHLQAVPGVGPKTMVAVEPFLKFGDPPHSPDSVMATMR